MVSHRISCTHWDVFCDIARGLILMMSILFRTYLSPLGILLGQVIIIMKYDTATETYLYINTEVGLCNCDILGPSVPIRDDSEQIELFMLEFDT